MGKIFMFLTCLVALWVAVESDDKIGVVFRDKRGAKPIFNNGEEPSPGFFQKVGGFFGIGTKKEKQPTMAPQMVMLPGSENVQQVRETKPQPEPTFSIIPQFAPIEQPKPATAADVNFLDVKPLDV